MTSTLTRARPMALDAQRVHRDLIRPGLYGVVAVMSADAEWIFRRDLAAPAEQWTGEYVPTGDLVDGKSLHAVRVKAARPTVLERFRAAAAATVVELGPLVAAGAAGDLVDLVRCGALFEAPATAYALAKRRLAILDGRVAPGDVDGMCACGAYLVGELHADACACCWSLTPGRRVRCPHLAEHQACPTPDPVICRHAGCRQRAGVEPCWTGDGPCDGCCDPR